MKKLLTLFLTGLMFTSAIGTPIEALANDVDKDGNANVKLGVEVLLEKEKGLIEGKKVGLITNPTGVDSNLNSIVDLLHEDEDVELVAMYGPEHGVRGDAQAGSEVESYVDEQTGVVVHSLYGNTRKPTPEMLEGVDTLIFDIQDAGARFYTYIYTMAYAMEAAQENNIEMIILDRPNPLSGNLVDGPILDEKFSSFVGLYPIPVMHGMTVGELAYYFNDKFDINSDLTIVPMENWNRGMLYEDTGLEYVSPSPNMPTTTTNMVYPGAGFFEGTNLSEGRGTTKPFELVGAPFINAYDYAKELNTLVLPGVKFRAASFTPISSKHQGTLVHGVQIHVLNPRTYDPLRTGLEMIIKLQEMYPEEFVFTPNWNNTSYFFNTLMGNDWVREDILAGKSYEQISIKWQDGLNDFKEGRKPYLIYDIDLDFNEIDQLIEKGQNLNADIYTEESIRLFEEAFTLLVERRDKILNNFAKNQLFDQLNVTFDLLVEKEAGEKKGWVKEGSEWYFYDEENVMQTGWLEVDNTWYYLSSTGAMQTGWNKVQHTWYYMSPSGVMQKGWHKVGNTWYYMSSTGAMQTGWNKVSNTWYYMSSSGAMQTGWNKIQHTWYYMSPNGAMQTGWNRIGNTWYYMSPSGAMQTGWLKFGSHWYYLNNNGSMQTQSTTINGQWYKFDLSGRML